jgi:2'-5' RNA ligase
MATVSVGGHAEFPGVRAADVNAGEWLRGMAVDSAWRPTLSDADFAMKIRTFIAVTASPEVRRGALDLIESLRVAAGDVKWVEEQNLHWTLQFLGDVDELETPAVCEAVAAAVSDLEPFELEARGAGAFPSDDRPRTLWLGAAGGSREMVTLQKAIQKKLGKLGFRGEQRRYVPHLTLGRAGRQSRPESLTAELAELADFDAGSMLVDEVTVYASRLGREGPTYEVLARPRLSG